MADDTVINPGAGGDTIAGDDIAGVKYQRVKLIHGTDGFNEGDISSTVGLPVSGIKTRYSTALNAAEQTVVISTGDHGSNRALNQISFELAGDWAGEVEVQVTGGSGVYFIAPLLMLGSDKQILSASKSGMYTVISNGEFDGAQFYTRSWVSGTAFLYWHTRSGAGSPDIVRLGNSNLVKETGGNLETLALNSALLQQIKETLRLQLIMLRAIHATLGRGVAEGAASPSEFADTETFI